MLSSVHGNPKGVRRDFVGLEERRLLAASLLRQGIPQAEVARQVFGTACRRIAAAPYETSYDNNADGSGWRFCPLMLRN